MKVINKCKLYKQLIAIAYLASVFISQSSLAQDTNKKQLVVQPAKSVNSLNVSFRPTKPNFKPMEQIQFVTRANKSFYLYVYTENSDATYTLILPNHLQKQNLYSANQENIVPNSNLRFMTDGSTPVERVFAIASTQYVDLALGDNKRVGDFEIISKRSMKKMFAAKGIALTDIPQGQTSVRINSTGSTQTPSATTQISNTTTHASPNNKRAETIILKAEVQIEGVTAPAPDSTSVNISHTPIVVFISSEKTNYEADEEVHFVFGANRAGYVSVFFVDPKKNGSKKPLLVEKVDGKGFISGILKIGSAKGRHTLLAQWAKNPIKTKALNMNRDDNKPNLFGHSFVFVK